MTIMVQRKPNTNKLDPGGRRGLRRLLIAAMVLPLAGTVWGQTPAATAPSKPHRAHKPRASQPAPVPQQPVEVTPPQPEMPKWPVNEAPGKPTVTWNSQGLHIQASNSSLSQILNSVGTQTGAKVEGVSGDERVFGDYGPGPARDVLSQLLRGSDYNFLLLGDQGQGTPRQVILTARRGGGSPNRNALNPQQPQDSQPDDEGVSEPEPDDSNQQQFQPQIQPQPQPIPQQEPMTPQQRMQMMQQQRLQQMQQLQQQYQQQQQQPQPQ